jgi:hypothetical protein
MPSLLRGASVAFVLLAGVLRLHAAAPPGDVNPFRVRVLLRKLDADSFHTRQKADETLRGMGPRVVPLLQAELERTSSPEVRFRLSEMVQDLTIGERIPALVRMLGHDNPQFGAQAEHALRQAGASVVPLLRKELRPTLDANRRKRLEKIIAELSAPRR